MRRIVIPDAGPLFSFAAAEVLPALLHFRIVITDVVKSETIDKGGHQRSSPEANLLREFYEENKDAIDVRPTQFGALLDAARRNAPAAKIRNAGELSIQSLLIELTEDRRTWEAAVIFEDSWFVRHATSFPPNCRLIGTTAFLLTLEQLGLIESAQAALARIQMKRQIR